MKKIISALFIILIILIPQDINATTSDTVLEKRKAIFSTFDVSKCEISKYSKPIP